jgi:hypothetical protein
MSEKRTIDQERDYIEDLLNKRFNYYLVFASLILVAVAGRGPLTDAARVGLLFFGAVASAMMALMVGRTRWLLQSSLSEILKISDHPYTISYKYIKNNENKIIGKFYSINVNSIMEGVVWLITLCFIIGAILTLLCPDDFFKIIA